MRNFKYVLKNIFIIVLVFVVVFLVHRFIMSFLFKPLSCICHDCYPCDPSKVDFYDGPVFFEYVYCTCYAIFGVLISSKYTPILNYVYMMFFYIFPFIETGLVCIAYKKFFQKRIVFRNGDKKKKNI